MLRNLKKLVFACLLAFFVSMCSAVDPEASALEEATLRGHMELLASAELQGRKALESGGEIAARYIASQFRKYGLQPGINNHSYFQSVPVETFEFQGSETVLHSQSGQDTVQTKTLRWGEDFWVFPRKMITSVSGDVSICGYGVQAPEADYDDYQGMDVGGNFVMVFWGEPETGDTTNLFGKGKPTRHGMIPVKVKLAEKMGAVGLILTTWPSQREQWMQTVERKKADWDSNIIQSEGDLEFPVIYLDPDKASRLMDTVDDFAYGEYIQELVSQFKGIPISFPEMELRFDVSFTNIIVDTVVNVVGWLGDSMVGGDAVIIGAHYDHIGVVDGQVCYGADDNASGVSALLTLAEALAPMKDQLQRSVLFVSFGAEEAGLIGSRYYVEHPIHPLENTVAMVNMDCIGREGSNSYRTMHRPPQTEEERNLLFAFYSAQYPDLKDIVLGMPNPDKLSLRPSALTGRFDFGDHAPFLHSNIPALFFFSGYHTDYHTPNDSIERIVFPKLTRITTLIYHVVVELANKSAMLEAAEVDPAASPTPMR